MVVNNEAGVVNRKELFKLIRRYATLVTVMKLIIIPFPLSSITVFILYKIPETKEFFTLGFFSLVYLIWCFITSLFIKDKIRTVYYYANKIYNFTEKL